LSLFKEKQNHEKRINEILKIVGLDKPLDTYATNLSYGQRKLLDLAVAIAKPHKVLLLDEPVAGVNPKLREQIKTILKKLNKQQKETIIVIEHDMNFVMNLASKIFVLDEGKVIASGKPKQIQNNKKVLEAYLGG
jgi:branched-chain amino acid transport system ATP-binding protein